MLRILNQNEGDEKKGEEQRGEAKGRGEEWEHGVKSGRAKERQGKRNEEQGKGQTKRTRRGDVNV